LIGVTGATGGVGSRTAARLARRGADLRLIVRDPRRAPNLEGTEIKQAAGGYGDKDGMRRALEGVDTLFLIPAGEDEQRLDQHQIAIDAAEEAGVERLVYLSFINATADATFTFVRDHYETEQMVKRTGLPHAFLRMSLYLDFVPMLKSDDGVIRGPAGSGRVAPVTRDDVAETAAAVLVDFPAYEGQTLDLTGPEALTMKEIAQEVSRVSGEDVRYEDETIEQARASRAGSGAPAWMIEGWVTTYVAIARGELDLVSDDVQRATGHPAASVREFLELQAAGQL
jgi:NAD(P)H dehydrogenase (quinone)